MHARAAREDSRRSAMILAELRRRVDGLLLGPRSRHLRHSRRVGRVLEAVVDLELLLELLDTLLIFSGNLIFKFICILRHGDFSLSAPSFCAWFNQHMGVAFASLN
mgnify:CR=1 FL=1